MNIGTDGRYKKIAVHNGSRFTQPTRIRIYKNGGWVDFGVNDSGNTNSINVIKNGRSVRATLNRKDTPKSRTVGAGYHQGAWGITTQQTYCFNNSGGAGNHRFYARFYVKTSGACRLFEFRSTYFDCSFYAGIKSDGTVYYTVKDNKWIHKTFTNEADKINMGHGVGSWQTIVFEGPAGSNYLYVTVNGNQKSFDRRTAWETNSEGTVGDGNLRIATNGTFIINTCDSPFTSISEDTTPEYYTETTWV